MTASSPNGFSLSRVLATAGSLATGPGLLQLIAELFPICRSLTGNGVRQTLQILRQQIPVQIHEVPSGTEIFDWVVPQLGVFGHPAAARSHDRGRI